MKNLLIFTLTFCLFLPNIKGQDFVSTAKVKDGLLHIKIYPKSLRAYEAYRFNGLTCNVSISNESVKTVSLKPSEDAEWIKKSESNKSVKVAFDLLKNKGPNENPSNLAEYIEADKSLRYSHGFYTIMSSLDRESSLLSGLEFSITIPSERIVLEIINSINAELNTTISIDPKNLLYKNQSPEIVGFNFDHAVKVAWDHEDYFQQVLAYKIQKKQSNGTFSDLDIPPKIYTTQKQSDPLLAYKMMHVDSLENNYQNEVYRIVGIDSFGDRMEPSNEVVLHGRDLTPPSAPQNLTAVFSDNTALLSWEKVDGDVDRILILRSTTGEAGPFEKTKEEFLSPEELRYSEEILDVNETYYYLMLVADSSGNVAQSYPTYLDIPDIYPPNNPTDVRTHVDTTGNVTLMWKHSDNNDIRGYKVFRAENRNHEFIQISKGTTPSNVFFDKLSLQMNNPKAYYYVKALDNSFNNSIPSDTIEVLRPDTISPSAPILRKAELRNDKINLAWLPSSSKDVKQYLVMADTGGGWWQHSAYEPNVNVAQMQSPSNLREVSFKVTAVDEVGNKSRNEAGRKVIFPAHFPAEMPFELNFKEGAISISWMASGDDSQTLVYRTDDDGKPRMLSKVNSNETTFIDRNVTKGEKYVYMIAKIKPDGLRSEMSVAQEIKAK